MFWPAYWIGPVQYQNGPLGPIGPISAWDCGGVQDRSSFSLDALDLSGEFRSLQCFKNKSHSPASFRLAPSGAVLQDMLSISPTFVFVFCIQPCFRGKLRKWPRFVRAGAKNRNAVFGLHLTEDDRMAYIGGPRNMHQLAVLNKWYMCLNCDALFCKIQ